MEEAERQREVLQFEEMAIDDTEDDTERGNDRNRSVRCKAVRRTGKNSLFSQKSD